MMKQISLFLYAVLPAHLLFNATGILLLALLIGCYRTVLLVHDISAIPHRRGVEYHEFHNCQHPIPQKHLKTLTRPPTPSSPPEN